MKKSLLYLCWWYLFEMMIWNHKCPAKHYGVHFNEEWLAFYVLKQLIKLLKDKFIKFFDERLQPLSSFFLKKENAWKLNIFSVSVFPITLQFFGTAKIFKQCQYVIETIIILILTVLNLKLHLNVVKQTD